MKKTTFLLALFCVLSAPAFAQRTVVSGTATDTNGTPYANASLTITLTTPAGTAGVYLGGAQITGSVGPVQLDSTGAFLVQLADNTLVQCANAQGVLGACVPATQWAFSITLAPGVAPPVGFGPRTCTATLTISGASQSVTSSFSACPTIVRSVPPSFPTLAPNGTFAAPSYSFSANTTSGLFFVTGIGPAIDSGSLGQFAFDTSNCIHFHVNNDNMLCRNSAQGNGAFVMGVPGGSTSSGNGQLNTGGFVSGGTTFTASGCGNTTLVGGATAGSYVSVTAGACSITITFGTTLLTSPHGYVCDAHDQTTTADANNINQTGSTTTSVTFAEGTVAANDVIVFKCIGF